MLVLTRKAQQQIQIGNNIVITIVRVKGQSVRVGIEAPQDVRVIRGELQFDGELSLEVESENESQEAAVSNSAESRDAGQPRTASSLKSKVAAVTERVRVDAFQTEDRGDRRESFNPADHRMQMTGNSRESSRAYESPRAQVISGRATLPMSSLGRINPR